MIWWFGVYWDSTWILRWIVSIFAKNIIWVLIGIVLNLSIILDNIDVLTILTLPIYEHGHISIYLCFRLCVSEFLRDGLFLICLYFSVQPILQGFNWQPQVFIIVPFTHTHTQMSWNGASVFPAVRLYTCFLGPSLHASIA